MQTRLIYLTLALGTIVLGLAEHFHGGVLGVMGREVLGDALWAMMIAWGVGAMFPSLALSRRSLIALLFCFVVETSQLIRVPFLDAIRASTLGHLVLGSGFDPRDFFSYAFGVLAAWVIEREFFRRRHRRKRALADGAR